MNPSIYLSDIQNDGTYIWETSKTVLSFSDWAGYSIVDPNLNCVRTGTNVAGNRHWRIEDCSALLQAVCQPKSKKKPRKSHVEEWSGLLILVLYLA